MTSYRNNTILIAVALVILTASRAWADPLNGEVLKFQQLPLNNGVAINPTPPNPAGVPYPGHDEWSTAYVTPVPNNWRGTFMADDFSDKVSTPVVHVRWWGSYDQNQAYNGVSQFLISFESDNPFDASINASRPDQVLSSQIVTPGALSPGSGTFTETLINPNMPEHLYQYNAELALPFQEQANTIYWLKIVALVDPATDGPLNWGWHDRDWSITDPLAAPVSPGERILGTVVDPNGTPLNVWHFQDDAVSGLVDVTLNTTGALTVLQSNYNPENYIFTAGAVPIDGPFGIQAFSKDLAFELYTVPEPASVVMFGLGALGLAAVHWRRRRAAAACASETLAG